MKCFEPRHDTPFSATFPNIIQIKIINLGNNNMNFSETLRTEHQIKLLLRTFLIKYLVLRKYQQNIRDMTS